MSQISAAPLRTTYWVFQIGSKLARSACGTKRSARAAARWEMAGAAGLLAASTAAAFRNALRSMAPSHKAAARRGNKRTALRRFIANTLAEVCRDAARLSHDNGAMRCAYCAYSPLHGLAHPPEERQRPFDHARDILPPSLIPQEEARRRIDHGLERGLVEAADRGLLLIERLGLIPRGHLRLDIRRVRPAEPGFVAARSHPDRDGRIDAVGARMPGVEH